MATVDETAAKKLSVDRLRRLAQTSALIARQHPRIWLFYFGRHSTSRPGLHSTERVQALLNPRCGMGSGGFGRHASQSPFWTITVLDAPPFPIPKPATHVSVRRPSCFDTKVNDTSAY